MLGLIVLHTFNPRTWEAEAGASLCSRQAWSTEAVPGLHRETLTWHPSPQKRVKGNKPNTKIRYLKRKGTFQSTPSKDCSVLLSLGPLSLTMVGEWPRLSHWTLKSFHLRNYTKRKLNFNNYRNDTTSGVPSWHRGRAPNFCLNTCRQRV